MRTILLFLFLALILLARFFFYFSDEREIPYGSRISFETTLHQEPREEGRIQRFRTELSSEIIFVTLERFPRFHYGDKVKLTGRVERTVLDDGSEINTLSFPEVEKLQSEGGILAISAGVRQKVSSVFKAILPPNSSGLLLGIVFGIKEEIPEDFYDELRAAGVLHVIAASGMNVTMVAGFLGSIFALVLRRQWSLILASLGIFFYAFLAGFEASIVRASIMAVLAFGAQLIGRQNTAFYSLFLTGFLMLFLSPSLLEDIGFQLSFLATFGIVFLKPLLDKAILPGVKFVKEDFTTTFSAQVTTLPILLFNFGTYSLLSILTNILVLWTVPLLMILGGASAILSFIPVVSTLFLILSYPLLIYFEVVTRILSDPFLIINFENFPIAFSVGYYLLLIALVFAIYRRRYEA